MKTDQSVASSICTSNGSSGKTAEEAYSTMPNQIKGICIGSVTPDKVVTPPSSDSWTEEPKFNINYQFLAMVQRFDGFENVVPMQYDSKVKVGALPSIKRPRWVTLTADYYTSAAGEEILCRLSPYTCEELGITRPDGIEAPIYDSYFILTPMVRSPANPLNSTIVILVNDLESRHERSEAGARQYSSTNSIPG